MSKTRLSVWLAIGAVLCGCGDSGAGGTTIGPAGPVGPAGPEGKSGNQAPALTLFTPQVAFAGRTVSVQISGGGTAFSGSEVIDFADVAINTDSVSAGSVSNLRASVSIGPSAQVGPHDVTVVSGTDVFKLAGGFTVAASLKPNTLTAPSVGQGGLIPYDVLNVDYQASPFSSGFRLNGGLHTVSQTSLSATRTVGMGLADALIPVGAFGYQASFVDPVARPITYTTDPADSLSPKATARTATAVTLTVALPGQNFAAPLSDNLYQLSTSANDQVLFGQFIGLGSAFAGGNVTVGAAYAGSDGKFGGGQLVPTSANLAANTRTMLAYAPQMGTGYIASWPTDFGGGAVAQYGHSFLLSALTGTKLALTEPAIPDTAAAPLATIASLAATSPNFATDGQADFAGDSDFIRFTAAAGTTRLYVQVVAPGASVQLVEHSSGSCAAQVSSTTATHALAYENTATPAAQRCLQVVLPSAPKYPWPYRLIVYAR